MTGNEKKFNNGKMRMGALNLNAIFKERLGAEFQFRSDDILPNNQSEY